MTTLNHWISQIEETKKLALSAATAEKSRVEIIKGQASTKFEVRQLLYSVFIAFLFL